MASIAAEAKKAEIRQSLDGERATPNALRGMRPPMIQLRVTGTLTMPPRGAGPTRIPQRVTGPPTMPPEEWRGEERGCKYLHLNEIVKKKSLLLAMPPKCLHLGGQPLMIPRISWSTRRWMQAVG